jgi:hypothetical protein
MREIAVLILAFVVFAVAVEAPWDAGSASGAEPGARIRIGPYPGGYPRVTRDELCVDPRPDHKLAVYLPWENSGYIVVDLPEVIFSNIGVLFLAHKHIPTIWTEKNVELDTVTWQRLPDGSMKYVRRLPNKVSFGATVIPRKDIVDMELFLENGTKESLTGLRTQVCVLLKEAKGFNQLTNKNKFFAAGEPAEEPLVAVRDEEAKRWIATAWDHCVAKWGRDLCPCMHSDPHFPDCPPGKRVTVRGRVFFFEGDIEKNYQRLKREGKLFWKP